jgi:hypothetical protein
VTLVYPWQFNKFINILYYSQINSHEQVLRIYWKLRCLCKIINVQIEAYMLSLFHFVLMHLCWTMRMLLVIFYMIGQVPITHLFIHAIPLEATTSTTTNPFLLDATLAGPVAIPTESSVAPFMPEMTFEATPVDEATTQETLTPSRTEQLSFEETFTGEPILSTSIEQDVSVETPSANDVSTETSPSESTLETMPFSVETSPTESTTPSEPTFEPTSSNPDEASVTESVTSSESALEPTSSSLDDASSTESTALETSTLSVNDTSITVTATLVSTSSVETSKSTTSNTLKPTSMMETPTPTSVVRTIGDKVYRTFIRPTTSIHRNANGTSSVVWITPTVILLEEAEMESVNETSHAQQLIVYPTFLLIVLGIVLTY